MPAPPCRSRRSPPRRRSRHSACPLTAHQPEQRRTRPAFLSTAATHPRHGATSPRLSGAISGNATEDAAAIGICSPGAAATRPICCRSTTCCRSPKAAARSRTTWLCNAVHRISSALLCPSPHAPRPRTGSAAGATDVAPPPRCCLARDRRPAGAAPVRRRWSPLDCAGRRLADGLYRSHRREPWSGRTRCASARRSRDLPPYGFLPLLAFGPAAVDRA